MIAQRNAKVEQFASDVVELNQFMQNKNVSITTLINTLKKINY